MFLEDELFDERAICEAIFKNSTEAILIADQTGRIVHVNPALLSLFNYGFYDLITQPVHMLLPEALQAGHQQHVDSYSENPHKRSMGRGTVLKGRKKNGDLFPLSASLSPTKIGDTALVVALIIDLTVIEEGKNQLSVLNQELEANVQRRTEQLAQSIKELEIANLDLQKAQLETQEALKKEKELNELKSRFVSMASHEFRTPLSTILSSLNLLEKYEKIENSTDKKEKHFDRIKSNVKHLNSILNDFLSLDKLQSGAVELDLKEQDLAGLIQQIVLEFETLLKPGQQVKVNFQGDKTFVTDANLLRNILINLIGNASKYSEANKEIKLEVGVSADLEITVIDQGMGIPEEDQKHMFERFFRAHNAMNIAGTGLGLTIVKRYAEMLGGTISFKSKEGIGTEFIVNIKGR
jgi:PAS domain S-box-containing protein